MKKTLLSLAALALSASAAFAQSAVLPASGATFSVQGQVPMTDEEGETIENAYTIGSRTAEVTVTLTDFNPELGYMPFIMCSNGGGFAINPPMPVDFSMVSMSEYEVSLNDENWGNPYMGSYYCTLMVAFMDEEGDMFMFDDEPVFYQGIYTTVNTNPAELLSVYPDGIWNNETFAQAYNRGEIRFNYTNVVDFDTENAIGMILYTLTDDDAEPVLIEIGNNAEVGWNPMDGNYTLTVDYTLDGVSANEIEAISISIFDAESLGETVDSVTIELENNNPNVQRIGKRTPAAKGLVVSNEPVSVYNIAGTLVKENITLSEVNALPKGLYIVNGKKVVVK